jgi:N-acetylglucosamine kinase-like BadF-type ATPase
MAGAAQATEWLKKTLASILPHSKITVAPDYEIALIGAHGKRYGILILSGTGSSACGINDSGESAHSGGWGYLIGDEGGGYWLGLETLKAVARAADGREEKTELYQQTFDHLKIFHPDDLISWTYNPERTNRKIAQISELVLSAASSGDSVASKIVESGAEHLYQLYLNLVKRLDFANPPVMFAGGLLSSDTLLQKLLIQKIGLKNVPCPKYSPVAGAALMAQLS